MSDIKFNDYTFGRSIGNEGSLSSAMITPNIQRPSSYSLENDDDHLPLTRERLEKKDKLDALIFNQPEPIFRRRSISNGNIDRQLYNEDNSPMKLQTSLTRKKSDNSNATVNSSISIYQDPLKYSVKYRPLKPNSSNAPDVTDLIDTSRGYRTDGFFIADSLQGQPRRFSGLVRLSATHIAMGRTRKSKKRMYQSSLYLFISRISAIASRVINTRTSEPAGTRMSVSELESLSKYLYALKYGNDECDDKSSDTSISIAANIEGETNSHYIPPPAIELFTDDEAANDNVHNRRTFNANNNSVVSTDNGNTPVMIKRHISSLGNIFPFTSIDRTSTISRSESENSFINEPTENDPLRSGPSIVANFFSIPKLYINKPKPIKKRMTDWISILFQSIKHNLVQHFRSQNYQQLHKSTQIRFEGWSLFVFSPTSLTRFHLWKMIGSRWFELLILFLLFCQWMLLSFLPIRFNTDQPFFTRPGDYILFVINIIYIFEACSKIIVYGFLLSTYSTSKPTLSTWIQHLRRPKFNLAKLSEEESISQIAEDDTNSTHTPAQQNRLPAFTSYQSISSSKSSLRNTSALSIASSGHQNGNSGSSIHSDSIIDDAVPPWASNSTYRRNTKHKTRVRDDQDDEDNWSILTAAERQVRASMAYNCNQSVHSSEYNNEMGDFLKVNHQPYLSSLANVLDLISIASYWIDVVMLLFFNKKPWSVFQAMAATRLLRLLVLTEGTAVIMKSLRSSYDMLKNVLGFFVFFWLLFSLVALFIFMNAFSRRCAVIPPGQPLVKNMTGVNYVEPRISCSGYMISETQSTGVFDINTGDQYQDLGGDGLYCKLGQICIQDTANQPGYGYISFENIFYSMLNILTVISTEDWTDLLYISQDSVSEVGAAIFYTFCIYLMTFIMVPMFIAVITTSFSHVRGDIKESAFSLKRKAKLILTTSISIKKSHQQSTKNENDSDDSEEEWTYGLGGTNIFQRNSIFHRLANHLTRTRWFPYVGSLLVTANIISMMFYNPKNIATLEKIESVFAFIFAIEIMIRLFGSLHWKLFWKSMRNRLDLIIVMATVVDQVSIVRSSSIHIYLLFFRVLRSYRISYLFPGVLQLMSEVLGDGQGLMNLTFFTFLVLFLLAPISVQLFGGDFDFVDEDEPSMRFDNSYQAFLALFQIMTGENWTDILYDAMHSQEHASVTYAALFMMFLYFAIHYMVLNLFIAVIMENFDLDEEDIKQIQIKKYIREHRWKPEYFEMDKISRFLLPLFILQDKQQLKFKSIPQDLVAHVTKNKFYEFLSEGALSSQQQQQINSPSAKRHNLFSFFQRSDAHSSLRSPSVMSFKSGHSRKSSIASQYSGKSIRLDSSPSLYNIHTLETESVVQKYTDEYELNVARENRAVVAENLGVFRSMAFLKNDHGIRKFCIRVVNIKSYNWYLVVMICISTVLAMWADEQNRINYPLLNSKVIEPIQIILLALYWIDVFIHMIADGIFMLPRSYLRNIWNVFDIMNLIAQVVFTIWNIVDHNSSLTVTHDAYLRMLRTFRSMRLVYYVQGMRVIFLDVIYGLPKMIDAVALNLLVFIPFAIYGCYLFSEKFTLCNDDSVDSMNNCYGEFLGEDEDITDILIPRVWKNPYDYSFDTFGESLLHLFECASGEGWIESLFSAMSVRGNTTDQPKFNWGSSSIFHSLFYVVFMFVASLCSIQLFIGVFLEIFKERSGISSLTNTQRQFKDLQRLLALVKPSLKAERPHSPFRALFYDLVIDKHGRFAQFMAAVLTLNIIVFATEHLHQPLWLTYLQNTLNGVFLSLYVFEMCAKIAGLRLYKWASALWNLYDFVLVTMTILTSLPNFFIELPFAWNLAKKLFLVGIAFRLAQRNESLDTLFRSIKRALPSIFFVSTVFGIVIVCFGVTFQEHFSTTKFGPYGNEHANFRSLFNSILTLFRITTGENWDFLMHDFAVQPPNCIGDVDCGLPNYAIGLFVVFYVVCTFIFVNLFTVIVIDNFSFTYDKRNQFTLITRGDLRKFKAAWSELDPRATGYISIDDIPRFLRQLDGALAIRIYEKEHSISALLEASNRIDHNFTHLFAFPLSEHQMATDFAGNNLQREQYFNVYEVNRCLSTINHATIKERKEQFSLIYQEIVNSATFRGVSFHKVLEILALRLVDISKSLTFEELVNRARIQDQIYKDLAAEKAKGLIAMLIQRREYIKLLKKAKMINRKSSSKNNNQSWLLPISPISPIKASEGALPFIQLRLPIAKSPPPDIANKSINEVTFEGNGSRSRMVPTIVIDKPRQGHDFHVSPSKQSSIEKRSTKKNLPERLSVFNEITHDEDINNEELSFQRHSKSIAAIHSGTLGEPFKTTTRFQLPFKSRNEKLNALNVSSPKPLTRRSSALSMRRLSSTASLVSEHGLINNIEAPDILRIDNTNNDAFTQYYAIEATMNDMSNSDAQMILSSFENNIWSELLEKAAYSSGKEDSQ